MNNRKEWQQLKWASYNTASKSDQEAMRRVYVGAGFDQSKILQAMSASIPSLNKFHQDMKKDLDKLKGSNFENMYSNLVREIKLELEKRTRRNAVKEISPRQKKKVETSQAVDAAKLQAKKEPSDHSLGDHNKLFMLHLLRKHKRIWDEEGPHLSKEVSDVLFGDIRQSKFNDDKSSEDNEKECALDYADKDGDHLLRLLSNHMMHGFDNFFTQYMEPVQTIGQEIKDKGTSPFATFFHLGKKSESPSQSPKQSPLSAKAKLAGFFRKKKPELIDLPELESKNPEQIQSKDLEKKNVEPNLEELDEKTSAKKIRENYQTESIDENSHTPPEIKHLCDLFGYLGKDGIPEEGAQEFLEDLTRSLKKFQGVDITGICDDLDKRGLETERKALKEVYNKLEANMKILQEQMGKENFVKIYGGALLRFAKEIYLETIDPGLKAPASIASEQEMDKKLDKLRSEFRSEYVKELSALKHESRSTLRM